MIVNEWRISGISQQSDITDRNEPGPLTYKGDAATQTDPDVLETGVSIELRQS